MKKVFLMITVCLLVLSLFSCSAFFGETNQTIEDKNGDDTSLAVLVEEELTEDEAYEVNAKLKALKAGYSTIYDYYVETAKKRMLDDYAKNGEKSNTYRKLEEKRILSYDKEKGSVLSVIAQHARLGDITEASLNDSILRFKRFVNDFKQKNKINYDLADDDSAYMAAVERGDMETAQRMVDEAARKADEKAEDGEQKATL